MFKLNRAPNEFTHEWNELKDFTRKNKAKYSRPNNLRRKAIRIRKAEALRTAILAVWRDFCTTSSFAGLRHIYGKEHKSIDM